MDEFFSKFALTKNNQALVVPEKREIYVREKDLDLESIHALKLIVTTCEQDIEAKSMKITTIKTKAKAIKREIQGLNPTSPQATQLKTKGVALLQEAKRIETDMTRRKQTKATLEKQIGNFEQVREAQEIQRLMKESNTRMQIALGEMDASEVASIGKEARKADRNANKVSDTLLNPFGEDVNEMDNEMANAFDMLELSDDDNVIKEDEYVPLPVRTNKPVHTITTTSRAPKRRLESDVIDDLF